MKTKILAGLCVLTITLSARAADPLPSWNDGKAKQSIIEFVAKVTNEGSPDFVPLAERIAVFDNDGTLWAEQPMYFQFLFMLDRVKVLAPQHPEWKTEEPFASLLKGDVKTALSGGERSLGQLAMATHAGMTSEEFEKVVKDWITTAKHPKTGRLFTEMVYQPMLELLAYLRANGFKTFIVSGGGIEFMRPWSEQVYGIPPEQVIGSSIKTKFELRDGQPVLVRLPEMNFVDDGPGKPVGIQMHIGRRPVAAFGNSDGDLEMLQWTATGNGPRFCLYVHHTDSEREWAYDRQSHIGKLDKGLDEAQAKGWILVDMKIDWKYIFAFETEEQTDRAKPSIPANKDFQKLNGRWQRPDGGYIIEVKNVDSSGKIDAAYLNPDPIHVAQAQATRDAAAIKMFLDLRDVNYPGSTYHLTYEPQNDLLQGVYYQAVIKQNFDVIFVRMK